MNKLQEVKLKIQHCALQANKEAPVLLLAVTKSKTAEEIYPFLEAGHRLFGENRIQESYTKWPMLKKQFHDIELHFIGHLQTNKVQAAVKLFDVIETLDSFKLAARLDQEQKKQNKQLVYYVEVNIGKEPQKTGIWPDDVENFVIKLKQYYPLNIQGLMCIPPSDENPVPYFLEMKAIATSLKLPVISMGMSEDYELAIASGSNLVRVGRALFD